MGFNIGWIDFSRKDRNKVLEMLRLLQERGAVDELGIGVVRDAFADRFFPGVSTQMTRAKYFVIVPYIIQEQIEKGCQKSWAAKEILEKIKQQERKLCERFKNGEDKVGIIGKRTFSKPNWLNRTPSEIYWNAIRRLGICGERELSLREYVEKSLENYREKGKWLGKTQYDEDEKDDFDAGGVSSIKPLDISEIYKTGWFENVRIGLSKSEAQYLQDRILSNLGGSVFATVIEKRIRLKRYCDENEERDFEPFANDISNHVESGMKRLLDLACYFSQAIYATYVRYNMIFQEGRSDSAKKLWRDLQKGDKIPRENRMDEVKSELEKKKIEDKGPIDPGMHIQNREVVDKGLIKLGKLLQNRNWRELDEWIKDREEEKKGKARAKLLHPEKSKAEWIRPYYLDYRLSATAQIVDDIYAGLGVKNV